MKIILNTKISNMGRSGRLRTPRMKAAAEQMKHGEPGGKKMDTHSTSFGAGIFNNIQRESGEEKVSLILLIRV